MKTYNLQMFSRPSNIKCFLTQSNIYDRALCENSEGFQLLTIFIKSSILDILLGFEYASK